MEDALMVIKKDEDKEILENVELDEVVSNQVKSEVIDLGAAENDTEEDSTESKDLYAEFSSFLEKKTDMKNDRGTKETIATGIDVVDAILGGGFAIGALNIIVGQPGSGKTMLAIQTLGQGQKQFKGNLLGSFLDSEEATTTIRLANLGVKYPKIKPYSDITVEKVFKFIEGMCVFKQEKDIVDTPSAIIWDSIANTLSQAEIEAEDVNQVIGRKARTLSLLIPKYVAKCAQNNICLLAVNQLRDVISMGPYGAPKDLKFMSATKDMPGGTILKYNAFHLVEMKVKSVIAPGMAEDSAKYGFEGVIVKVKCVKNKLFPPNIEVEMVGSFTTGFSNFWTNYNFLKNAKRLNSGAWNYLVDLPDKKFRTKDAPELYNTDEVFRKAFKQAVKETIQAEIIDKYSPEL
jgi:RecA/RadA recombinase